MTQHTLKLNQQYFDAVNNGIKNFAIVKANKGLNIGDTIKFVCTDDYGDVITVPNYKHPEAKEVELRTIVVIQYIQTWEDCEYIAEGYCIVGFKKAIL